MPTSNHAPAEAAKLFLVDGSALAYRSHFAFIRNPLTNSRGEPTSAIFGFVRALLKIIDEERPTHLAVMFDTPEPTFRHRTYPAYKATRQKMPEDLVGQLARLRDFTRALGALLLEVPGYEADDLMGTLARRAAAEGIPVYLCSGDKDFMQLVEDRIFIYYTGRSEEAQILDAAGVREKIGVPPHQVVDYLALLGDTSDNVPGVPKIGAKTAQELLAEFGTLEDLLANVEQVTRAGIRENLKTHAEQARLSRQLVTIDTSVPLDLDIAALAYRGVDRPQAATLCRELEFSSLLPRFAEAPRQTAAADYRLADTPEKVRELMQQLARVQEFAFDTETTSADPLRAELVGMSFSWEEGRAYYVPVAAPAAPGDFHEIHLDPAGGGGRFPMKSLLQPLLEDPQRRKCGQNAKYDMLVMARYGIVVRGVNFDTMIASYVLNPGGRQHNLDALCLEHFNHQKIPTRALLGTGKKQKTMREVPVQEVARYAAEDADFTLRLRHLFARQIAAANLQQLFEQIEMPLVQVLTAMEWEGITLDLPYLSELSLKLEALLGRLVADIHELAGGEFNLNSPQQLGRVLFEQLKLPRRRKTKTGYSTDAEVLEELAKYHELPRKLLEYRELAKLKSTYVEALPQLVNPDTGRLHTSFNQTVAATGRLSSSEPNLQNIPIRTELGRQIRRAFIPRRPDWRLLDADYSQIELRLVAHLSQDPAMIAAFRSDEDIHTATAGRVFNVPASEVTPELRRRAKEINFGIIYGMGAYGLSRRLGISTEEAQNFITSYFAQYPGVNQYIMGVIAEAHKNGFVTTLYNRRRFLPDLNSDNQRVREAAERTAINTPIQGTAADLIKIAMINIHRRLQEAGLQAHMILQVHDELVFEAPEHELEPLRDLVVAEMSGAARLAVPVKIDVGLGANWLEAH